MILRTCKPALMKVMLISPLSSDGPGSRHSSTTLLATPFCPNALSVNPYSSRLDPLINPKYAHSSFSSLVQSLLPKDTLLRTYLLQNRIYILSNKLTVLSRAINTIVCHLKNLK